MVAKRRVNRSVIIGKADVDISYNQVTEFVGTWGIRLDRICLVAGDEGRQGSIMLWRPTIGGKCPIFEDEAFDAACYAYLRHQGALEFKSEGEVQQHARRKRWAGWNKKLPRSGTACGLCVAGIYTTGFSFAISSKTGFTPYWG